MFWENTYEYTDIMKEAPSIEELEKYCKENNIYLDVNLNSTTRWTAAASMYGAEHGLDSFITASFSSMIATYMSGMTSSAGTEAYFDEERIDSTIIKAYNDMQNLGLDEKQRVKMLFEFIFNLYNLDIANYELKNRRLDFRLTERQYTEFMETPGENKTDKLRYLLEKE